MKELKSLIRRSIMKHRRRTRRFNFLFLSTVFIWCVPWGIDANRSQGQKIAMPVSEDTLSNEELHKFLSLFDHDKVTSPFSTLTTPSPNLRPRPTPSSSSFLPTEVIQSQRAVPMLRRASPGHTSLKKFEETSASDLIQQLNLLNILMESSETEKKTNSKVKAIIDDIGNSKFNVPMTKFLTTPTTTTTTTPKPKTLQSDKNTQLENDKVTADLHSLALLHALINTGQPSTEDNLGAVSTLLGLNTANKQSSSPPALRNIDDKEAATFFTNLLLSQSGHEQQQQSGQSQPQNFQGFTNSQANLDAASSNQLTGLLSLLGTIGSLSGGGQMSNLLNLGGQQQQPNLLTGLLGGGQQQATSNGLLSTMLGLGNNQNQQQINLLANLLGNQAAGSSILTQQQQAQPPGVVSSLVGLGSSVSSALGQTLNRLSGTRADGKPRVRGFDTRLGLGYRLGQNMDAQLMWEVGPQLFTEPLGEKGETETLVNSASEVQPAQYAMTPEMRQKLAEVISRNLNNVQKRHQILINQAKVKEAEEREHERLGKLFHVTSPSQYSPRIYHPRQQLRFQQQPRREHYPVHPHFIQHPQSGQSPSGTPFMPSGYIQPPQAPPPPPPRSQLNTQYPILSKVPSTSPVVRVRRRQAFRNKRIPFSMPVKNIPLKNIEEAQNMLTDYEKWLLNKRQEISKRQLNVMNENQPYWMIPNNQSPNPLHHFKFHPLKSVSENQEQVSPTNESSSRKKIYRLTKKTQEPTTTLPREMLLDRMGSLEPPSPLPIRLFRPPRNSQIPKTSHFPLTHSVSYPPRFHYAHFLPPPRFQRIQQQQETQYRTSSIHNPYYNPHQNFIPESEDSFLRRNAIVTNPNLKKKVQIQNERLGTTHKDGSLDFGDLSIRRTASMSGWTQPSAMIGMFKKAITNPVTRYLFPTTPLPPIDDQSMGHFNPTTEPVLIATPTVTPIPSFYDHLGRPKPTKATGGVLDPYDNDNDEHTFIHIGEELSYGDLAQTMDVRPRPRIRKYKNGTKTIIAENETQIVTDRPINPPGMEMFIDIDSGEVSVRKAVASLAHFGEVTTTPKSKTYDELEDEESLNLYERLQDYFKSSMEAFKLNQAVRKATKEHKDKIRLEQDESLGLVNRYFDLLEDNADEGVDAVTSSTESDLLQTQRKQKE